MYFLPETARRTWLKSSVAGFSSISLRSKSMSPIKHTVKKETYTSYSDKQALNCLLGTGCSSRLLIDPGELSEPPWASSASLGQASTVRAQWDSLGVLSSLDSHINYQMSVLGWGDGPMGDTPAAQQWEPSKTLIKDVYESTCLLSSHRRMGQNIPGIRCTPVYLNQRAPVSVRPCLRKQGEGYH